MLLNCSKHAENFSNLPSYNISMLFIHLIREFIFEYLHQIDRFSKDIPCLLKPPNDQVYWLITTCLYISQVYHIGHVHLMNLIYKLLMRFSSFLLVHNKELLYRDFYQQLFLTHTKCLQSIKYLVISLQAFQLYNRQDIAKLPSLINNTDTFLIYFNHLFLLVLQEFIFWKHLRIQIRYFFTYRFFK